MEKIESRESFEVLCQNSAEKMFKDLDLLENALDMSVSGTRVYVCAPNKVDGGTLFTVTL